MLLLLFACKPDPSPKDGLSCIATVNPAIHTVVDVAWAAPAGSRSYVQFGEDDGEEQRTNGVRGTVVRLPLVGLPGGTEVHWTGVSETPDGTQTCSGRTTSGTVPDDFPVPSLNIHDPILESPEPYLLGTYFNDQVPQGYLVAFNREAEVVWYWKTEANFTSMDLQPAADGNGLIYNQFFANFHEDKATLRRIDLDGNRLDEVRTPGGHHMFAQLPDGTLAFQQLDIRSYPDPDSGDLVDVAGDAIAEVAWGGEARTVFSLWDWMTPTWDSHVSSLYNGADWSHGNALKVAGSQYLLSLGGLATVVEVDRSSHELTRTLADPAADFHHQHDPGWLDNGNLLMFITQRDGHSGAVEYAIKDSVFSEVWRSNFDLSTFYLGQARRLSNGNTYINFGSTGVLREELPDGTIAWEVSAPSGLGFAQGMLVNSLYPPETPN